MVGKSFGAGRATTRGLHPVDAFLDLVLEHGTALRWRTTISNHRPEVLKKLAREPGVQMGFSDAGAHLRNMAFYNMGLRLLRHVRDAQQAGTPFMTVEQAVHRLTGELADWYRLDAGHLRVGDRADIVGHRSRRGSTTRLDDYAEDAVEQYGGLSRMVNRNDETVTAVFVGGRAVFLDGEPTDLVGRQRTGRFLRAAHRRPHSPTHEGAELAQCRLRIRCSGMWKALSARDWETRQDLPVPTTASTSTCRWGRRRGAQGPEDIVKRLKIGLEPLASYENFDGLLVDNGVDAMYEHHEEWMGRQANPPS